MSRREAGRARAEAIARDAYGKLVACLATETRNIAAAEDALSEAFTAALRHWADGPVPDNPEGWLLGVARRRLIDQGRRRRTREAYAAQNPAEEAIEAMPDTDIPERRLELMFACANPAIDQAIHAPLMLQTVLGLSVEAIAQAMLLQPATLAQRLVRAKSKIRDAGIPFRIPDPEERSGRFPALLDALYVAYGAGWEDVAGGADPIKGHASEAIWLARLVVRLAPSEPEALGLLALMLHAEARRGARFSPDGAYAPVEEQDVAAWDSAMIAEAEQHLARAAAFNVLGRFQLEAAIQSALAQRLRGCPVAWEAIVRFSDRLVSITRSPAAIVNHAAALLKIGEPAVAMQAIAIAAQDPRVARYQPYWATRAVTLKALGLSQDAESARVIAIDLCADPAVKAWLRMH